MLGTSDESLAFIQEFTTRRFKNKNNNKSTAGASSSHTQSTSSPPQQKQRHEPQQKQKQQGQQNFPSLPAEQNRQTDWPANINVYMKKDTQGDYFSG